jgi:serine/threonine protein kinase
MEMLIDFLLEGEEKFNTWLEFLLPRMISTAINEDYEFMDVLGKGTFSTVFRVRSLENKKLYKIKKIYKNRLTGEGQLFQLVREITVMKKLKGEDFVKIHKVYEDEDTI